MAELLAGRYELVDRLDTRDGPRRCDPGDVPPGATVGAVWRAWDHGAGGYLALKVMQHAAAAPLQRFVRETSHWLRHRHIATPVWWVGVGDLVLFAMPLVRGGSIATLVAETGPLPVPWAATLVDQLLDALGFAHGGGVAHGDIRAERLLLDAKGPGPPALRLTGFGARDGDPRADLAAVGAMAAGLLVRSGGCDGRAARVGDGSGGVERTFGAGSRLARSAPLGIPAVLGEFLARLTDGGLTAEQARGELDATGCLPGDWSRVPGDAMVETVDQLPPYPPGWGPRGPIAFAAPGLVRPEMPRSLDERSAESGGSPVSSDQPHPSEFGSARDPVRAGDADVPRGRQDPRRPDSDDRPEVSHDLESASRPAPSDATGGVRLPSQGGGPSQSGGSSQGGESGASDGPGEWLFPERDEGPDAAAQEPDVSGSALAELLDERGDASAALDPVPVPPQHAEQRRSEAGPGAGSADDPGDADGAAGIDPYGPMPELQLDPVRRFRIPRPDLSGLREKAASALARLTVPDPRRLLRSPRSRRPRLAPGRTGGAAPRLPHPRRPGTAGGAGGAGTAREPGSAVDPAQAGDPGAGAEPFDGAPRIPRRSATLGERPRLWNPIAALPGIPTPSPRGAETLRTVGVSAMLLGAGLMVAALAVLLFV